MSAETRAAVVNALIAHVEDETPDADAVLLDDWAVIAHVNRMGNVTPHYTHVFHRNDMAGYRAEGLATHLSEYFGQQVWGEDD